MSTKIKLLHENTEYRQDNLSVYDITLKIMPVPWLTMDKGKKSSQKVPIIMMESAVRCTFFLRRLFLEAQQTSRNAHNSQ